MLAFNADQRSVIFCGNRGGGPSFLEQTRLAKHLASTADERSEIHESLMSD